jgi:hypothetical protein
MVELQEDEKLHTACDECRAYPSCHHTACYQLRAKKTGLSRESTLSPSRIIVCKETLSVLFSLVDGNREYTAYTTHQSLIYNRNTKA